MLNNTQILWTGFVIGISCAWSLVLGIYFGRRALALWRQGRLPTSPVGSVASANSTKTRTIGMPTEIYLHEFGDLLFKAFGVVAYHVGSSTTGPVWRDVDVRIMLEPAEYQKMGLGRPEAPSNNPRWCAYVTAFSELGRKMTGLPIDFQIQDRDQANKEFGGCERNALILGCLRRQQVEDEKYAQGVGHPMDRPPKEEA